MNSNIYHNRVEAGEKLAKLLKKYKREEAVVLALPYGGVITAGIIAKKLGLPLGLVVVRKIGYPYNPEYVIAAISECGQIVKNEEEIKNVDKNWFKEETERQLVEAKRRREKYWGKRKLINLTNKIAIIVDDDLATDLVMMAAIKEVKNQKPKKIVVAVPVSPKDAFIKIKREVDEFVAISIPEFFMGTIGAYYENFPQITDDGVVNVLHDSLRVE